MGCPVHDCMKKCSPSPFFCSAHIELTNHVATSLHSLVANFPSLWFYVPCLSSLPHSISHIILTPVSEGWEGPDWSGCSPEQPERPYHDPEHLPAAEEPERAGQKPVWACYSSTNLI